jgi:hypothetical protein
MPLALLPTLKERFSPSCLSSSCFSPSFDTSTLTSTDASFLPSAAVTGADSAEQSCRVQLAKLIRRLQVGKGK